MTLLAKTHLFLLCTVITLQTRANTIFTSRDFSQADSIAALYPNHSLHNLKELADKLTLPLGSEEEKFRAIFRWVCTNIAYDYPLHQQNQRMRAKLGSAEELNTWNRKISDKVFKALIRNHRTVCTGYAYLVRELAICAGIPCVTIDGYGRTAQANIKGKGIANHTWNAVKLEGTWYLCDPTWSSGAYDTQAAAFIRQYTDAYFLADPALFIRNHYPLDTAWTLLNVKPSLSDFLNGPLIYVNAYSFKISHLIPETFEHTVNKGEKVSFVIESNGGNSIGECEMIVKSRGLPLRFAFNPKYEDGRIQFDQVFNSKGTHVVHLLIDQLYVVTYSIHVN